MQNWLSQFNLNPNQNDAVIYDEGPLLLLPVRAQAKQKRSQPKLVI